MDQNCFRRRSYAIRKARFLFMSWRICFARWDLAPVRTPILFFKRTNPFSPLLNICMRTFLAFEIWPFSHRIDKRLELYMSPRRDSILPVKKEHRELFILGEYKCLSMPVLDGRYRIERPSLRGSYVRCRMSIKRFKHYCHRSLQIGFRTFEKR